MTFAQQQVFPLDREHRLNYEKYLYKTDKKKPFHTSVKPFVESEVYEHVYPDTTYGLKKIEPTNGFKKGINVIGYEDWIRFDETGFIKPTEKVIIDGDTVEINKTSKAYQERKFYIAVNPILHFAFGRGNNNQKVSYNTR